MIGAAKASDARPAGDSAEPSDRESDGLLKGGPTQVIIAAARLRQRRRRKRILVATATSVLALAGGLAGWHASSSGSAPAGPSHSLAASTWRTVGHDLWDHGAPGNLAVLPAGAAITCAGGGIPSCYVEIHAYGTGLDGSPTDPGVDPGDSPDQSEIFRSGDGGSTWSKSTLPASTWLSSPISCSDASDCAVGASIGGRAAELRWGSGKSVMLVTTDGGRTWVARALPPGVGTITDLSCPSASECVALAVPADAPRIDGMDPYAGVDRFYPTNVLVTTDAGRTWSKAAYPAEPAGVSYYVNAVECPSEARCYFSADRSQVVRDLDGSYSRANSAEVILASRDGGRSLGLSTSPAGGWIYDLTCPDPSSCEAVVSGIESSSVWYTHDAGRTWGQFALSGQTDQIEAIYCSTGQSCIGSAPGRAFVTDDGGARWSALPDDDNPGEVSCNRQMRCVGLQATPRGDRPVRNF